MANDSEVGRRTLSRLFKDVVSSPSAKRPKRALAIEGRDRVLAMSIAVDESENDAPSSPGSLFFLSLSTSNVAYLIRDYFSQSTGA